VESCCLIHSFAQIFSVEKIFDFLPEGLFNDQALLEPQLFTDGVEGVGKIEW
jgi:hypothetical protein